MAPSPPASVEALLRELVAQINGRLDGVVQRMDGVDQRLDDTREDAREARDAALRLTERLSASDVPAHLAKLEAAMTAGFAAARSDLVNASDKLTRNVNSVEDRVAKLEAFRQRVEGATGFVGWIGKNMPWLIAVVMAVAAAIGLKDQIP